MRNDYLIFLFRYSRIIEGPNFKRLWYCLILNFNNKPVDTALILKFRISAQERTSPYEMPQRTRHKNDVVLTSVRRYYVASTSIRRHFGTECPLGVLIRTNTVSGFLFRHIKSVQSRRNWLFYWLGPCLVGS